MKNIVLVFELSFYLFLKNRRSLGNRQNRSTGSLLITIIFGGNDVNILATFP